MTDRLYYSDSYLTRFKARILDADSARTRVYLDRTAFYPTSGGQPFDLGALSGVPVLEVIDEADRIAHVLAAPLASDDVDAEIDWKRRFDHMQQHTGQHLLSAVCVELLRANTLSFHLGAESATIDLDVASVEPDRILEVERTANEIVFENRPVSVEFQHASQATDLRKASVREGVLRIVSIQGLDRSACGGTHVRATGEIGPILIRKLDKVRGSLRVEFLCGGRAVRRARADYDALAQIARIFSAPLEATPALVEAQMEKAQEADKARRRISAELATARGRELYAGQAEDPDGVRRLVRQVDEITEDLRAEAQSFTAGPKAVLLILGAKPPSALLAASKDSGLNAGHWMKAVLAEAGGRGGGSPTMAQASLPSADALQVLADFMGRGEVFRSVNRGAGPLDPNDAVR